MEKYLEEIRYKILHATCKRYCLSSVSCYLSLSVAVAMPILTNYRVLICPEGRAAWSNVM